MRLSLPVSKINLAPCIFICQINLLFLFVIFLLLKMECVCRKLRGRIWILSGRTQSLLPKTCKSGVSATLNAHQSSRTTLCSGRLAAPALFHLYSAFRQILIEKDFVSCKQRDPGTRQRVFLTTPSAKTWSKSYWCQKTSSKSFKLWSLL